MKAKLIGMSAYQGTPVSGTLRIYRADRYEDGQGNAAVRLEEFKWRAGAGGARGTWGDPFNPAVDAYTVVSAAGEPAPVEGLFEEVFNYADGSERRSLYRKNLIATNLVGTEFDYTQPQGVTTYSGSEPITFQAARDLLTAGTTKLAEVEQALAASAQWKVEAEAAIDASLAENAGLEADVLAGLAKLEGLQIHAYPQGKFKDGHTLVMGFEDSAGNIAAALTDTGKWVEWGGLQVYGSGSVSGNLRVIGTLNVDALQVAGALSLLQATIADLTTGGLSAPAPAGKRYIGGAEVARVMEEDANGNVLRAYDLNGKMLVPGGIDVPKQPVAEASGRIDALTTTGIEAAAPAGGAARYLSGRTLARVIHEDAAGNIVHAYDESGAAIFPGGIVAPNVGAALLPSGYTLDSDGRVRIDGRRLVQRDAFRMIGDSMVEGNPWRFLSEYGEPRPYVIEAQGGAGSTSIAVRVGAYPVYVNAQVDVPAGGVEVAFVPTVLWLSGSGNRTMDVTYGGVTYTVRHDNHNPDGTLNQGQPYFIKRKDGGAATTIPGLSHLAVIIPPERPEYIPVLWMYRNNFSSTDAAVRDIQSVVQQHLRAVPGGKFLVIGTCMGVSEPVGGTAQNAMDVTATALQREFGAYFQDPRAWMVAGDPATSTNGGLPSSYSPDGTHHNEAGQRRFAQFVIRCLRALSI